MQQTADFQTAQLEQAMQNLQSATGWDVTEPGVMTLDRFLSNANAPDLEEDARLCIMSGERSLVLDCAALSYMTGAGTRAILAIARRMYEVGGKLYVRNLSGQPREMFEACGLQSFIPVSIRATLPTAVAA